MWVERFRLHSMKDHGQNVFQNWQLVSTATSAMLLRRSPCVMGFEVENDTRKNCLKFGVEEEEDAKLSDLQGWIRRMETVKER